MNVLFIIRSHPQSPAFQEAVTALLGSSLFGQEMSFLLMGDAAAVVKDPDSPLAQVTEMALAEGYLYAPGSPVTEGWSGSLKRLQQEDAAALLSCASHILSF